MLRVLSHLNYKPWFALGEFVDNAIQSYLADPELSSIEIRVDIDATATSQIVIRDNSSGIARIDFDRAFKPAIAPPDASGLSEFGMGMKSAAYWFSDAWSVVTSSAGVDRAYAVDFDIDTITENELDTVAVSSSPAPVADHFTEVKLTKVRHVPVGRTVGKIKDHLRDIYRNFIESGAVTLIVNGEVLEHKYPIVLQAPHFADSAGEVVFWRVEFDFEVAPSRRAYGFAAIRDPGSTKNTGLSLFRRGRIIQGSGDEGYMPTAIFGSGNSYESQRIFGDVHLEGFGVSHTKDGLQWDGLEDHFLEKLREVLDGEERPLLRQAKHFRKFEFSRAARRNLQAVIERTAHDVGRLESDLESIVGIPDLHGASREPEFDVSSEPLSNPVASRTVTFEQLGLNWTVIVESTSSLSPSEWFTRSINKTSDDITIRVQLNMSHPFVIRFCQRESESLEAVTRLAVALSVGETLARLSGTNTASAALAAVNSVITKTFSGE
jgi:hypothetical protein